MSSTLLPRRGRRRCQPKSVMRRGVALVTVCSLAISSCGGSSRSSSEAPPAASAASSASGGRGPVPAPPPLEDALATLQTAAEPDKVSGALEQLGAVQASLKKSSFDVAAKAAELGADVDAAYRFVRDEVRFEPYEGVLRGARGTLMALAGNAFDKSVLLAELLRHHQVEVRFKTATLPQERAVALVARMTASAQPPSDVSVPALGPDVTAVSQAVSNAVVSRFVRHVDLVRAALEKGRVRLADRSPVPMDVLVQEARRHCWIEYRRGGEWIPLDPSVGDISGVQSAGAIASTAETLPATTFHRLVIHARIEERRAGVLTSREVLRHEATSADLHGAAVTFEPSLVKVTEQGWVAQPVLKIDARTIRGDEFRGGVATGLAGSLDAGVSGLGDRMLGGLGAPPVSVELAALWIDVDFIYPSGRTETVRRALFDRVGPAARLLGTEASEPLAAVRTIAGVPAPMIQLLALSFNAGPLDPASLAFSLRTAALQQTCRKLPQLKGTAAIADADLNGLADGLAESQLMLARTFHAHSALARRMLETPAVHYYEASPRLAIASVGLAASQDGQHIVLSRTLDLRRNDVRTVGTAPGRDLVWANVLRGVLDGVVEHTIGGELGTTKADGSGVSAVSILERAAASAPPVALTSVKGWAGNNWPDASKARLAVSLQTGALAIVPARAVDFDGERRAGWWSIQPATGETLSVMDTGLNGAAAQEDLMATAKAKWATLMMNTQVTFMLLMAIHEGDWIVRSASQDNIRTAVIAIGAGIIGVIAALLWGADRDMRETNRRRSEESARRPPAPEG